MDELGSILREAREAKGLTLAGAQEATRINSRFLEAMENAQYEVLPTPVHVRGFLRNYARFLDLDPAPLLERYELNRAQRPLPAAPAAQQDDAMARMAPISGSGEQPFFDPVNVELGSGARRDSGSVQRLVIIIALLIALGLIANRFIPILRGDSDGSEALSDGINDAVSEIINNGAAPEASATPDTSLIPGAGEPITSTERNDVIQLPTATATRPQLPVTLDEINLRLDITERTWLQLTIDGDVVYEGLARRNETLEYQAEQEAILLTGNAIGIFVTINEIQLGKLGGRGEVVEESWTITQN